MSFLERNLAMRLRASMESLNSSLLIRFSPALGILWLYEDVSIFLVFILLVCRVLISYLIMKFKPYLNQ
jgi:hypothetical protein